jgi:hypothetical protein
MAFPTSNLPIKLRLFQKIEEFGLKVADIELLFLLNRRIHPENRVNGAAFTFRISHCEL